MDQKALKAKFFSKVFLLLSLQLFCLFVSCSPSSCQIEPVIQVPEKVLTETIEDAYQEPFFDQAQLQSKWWQIFNDHQLNSFLEEVFKKNPNLQSAKMRVFADYYYAASIRSSLSPYIDLGADVSRQKLSKTGVIPFSSNMNDPKAPISDIPVGSNIPFYFSLYETELNMTYSFDFWNKNKNAFCAALGLMQTSIAEEAFIRLGLGIAAAKAYYALQTDYEREEIAKQLVDNRKNYLELIKKRVENHIDNALSLQIAQSNLVDASNFLLQVQEEIALKKHLLSAYRSGNFEEEILSIEISRQKIPKVPLPQDLPLHLVSRRPDITAKLWLIESAGRQIDVAKAGFYPDINLSAFFGFQTIHFAELFKGPSAFFNVNPALSLPIFDGGRLTAELRSSEVNYDLAISEYNNLVINAVKEVLDAITSLRNQNKLLEAYKRKWEHQTKLYELTKLRVANNLDSSFEELISEEQKLLAKEQEISALRNTFQAILNLIQALGGGYDNCRK